MMSASLLLSEWATMNNKPELEIFADDVQCGHGATNGALDEDLLFYLMARGLPAPRPRACWCRRSWVKPSRRWRTRACARR
jgi:Fe-S cluster assembly protein SufD